MNYQYIEQLIERYFDCQTSLHEEQILRSFFQQEDVPAHLLQYSELFLVGKKASEEHLDKDFDAKMLNLIAQQSPRKPLRISIRRNLAPFFKAAAIVAVFITVGNAAEHALTTMSEEEETGVAAIDPYTKTSDIRSTLRVKDVSKAENSTLTDTIISVPATTEKSKSVQ